MSVREGAEASWPNEKKSDNTIQAAHSFTFCFRRRKQPRGRGLASDPMTA